MPPQLGAQTFRSHGKEIARIHMHDWIILFLLLVIEVVLNVIEPFHRFVGADMMTDLKYPMKGNTIPVWAVPIIAIILPFTVMLGFFFRGTGRNVYDLHQAILGLLFSVLITGVITDAIKDGVGRPRPDFFWRCFPDGKGVFDSVTGNVKCTGLKNVIKEGHKSFPSGHTSWSFAGLGFLSWYLSGKIKAFDQQGHAAKLCIVVLPLLFAALVGVSRVDDYWHHWQDVFAGGFIGFTVASFCYLQFFPPPYDVNGCMPHVHNARMGESRNGTQPPMYDQSSSLAVRQTELENVYARSQHGLAITEFNVPDSSPILSDVESGRRY